MFEQTEISVISPLVLRDRYELQDQISQKPGRRVFIALDRQTQTPVIVKWLTFDNDFTWDVLKLFEREAEVLKSLNHPAIPKYLDYFDLDLPQSKGFVLVQSLIQAKSLEEHLRAGRTFSEEELVDLAKQVLEILKTLHDRNPPIIHRDIKPSNILLGDRSGNSVGQVYLIDFGAVQTLIPQEGQTFTVVGTYGYMPMEQFGGRTVAASDLYSLGATLLRVVTGQEPAELPQKDLRFEFEAIAQISPEFTYWLKQMVEPDLQKRYANATVALAGLNSPQVANHAIAALIKRQPDNSPLMVKVQDGTFHLHHPKFGHDIYAVVASIFGGLLLIPILFATGLSGSPGSFVGIAIATLILFGCIFWVVGSWNQKLDIVIDANFISRKVTFFDRISSKNQRIPRDRISRIELGTYFVGHSTVPSFSVNIIANGQSLDIPHLLKREAQWLVGILQQWLGVEVTIYDIAPRSPIPKNQSNH
jgi:serine/threonine protein kinase